MFARAHTFIRTSCAIFLAAGFACSAWSQSKSQTGWAIEIHGGAGEAEWLHMEHPTADAYHASLEKALAAGAAVLSKHGTAMDAVEAAVEVLEDDPLFNAGRGAAFAADGTNELDASIMNGADTTGAGVAGVHFTRHPIQLARAVMQHTQYVLMAGPGADAFSKQQGLEQEPAGYFFTEMRWKEFEDVMRKSGRPIPARPAGATPEQGTGVSLSWPAIFSHLFGTVGAVARDSAGHLAAATSTGGMQGKLPGRIGDSPILGAGTYADDRGCAISGTGVGEYFIRLSLAHQVGELCRTGETPQKAADRLIHNDLPTLPGGEGGVIVVGRNGPPVWSNNTLGMFHARQVESGSPEVWVK